MSGCMSFLGVLEKSYGYSEWACRLAGVFYLEGGGFE